MQSGTAAIAIHDVWLHTQMAGAVRSFHSSLYMHDVVVATTSRPKSYKGKRFVATVQCLPTPLQPFDV